MLYAIIGRDVPDSQEKRKAARPAHVARLQALMKQGRLFAAGPFPAVNPADPAVAKFSGSLILAEFRSLVEAKAWAKADPYVIAKVYSRIEVKPFKKVLPA